MKPLIGITCNYDYSDDVGIRSDMGPAGQDWNLIAGDYIYSIEKAGGIPVLIPQFKNFDNARGILARLDGVLISGGNDVGTERYGAFPKEYCGKVMPERDQQDIEIAKYVLKENIPVLGICRGAQIINVALGGTLYQDIEKEGSFENHSNVDRYPRNYPWHKVSLSKGSLLASVFGTEEIAVNSLHHQAVLMPGANIKITAVSSDGVAEGIEVAGQKFAVAVQWHPEMMYDSFEQEKLFAAFLRACGEKGQI